MKINLRWLMRDMTKQLWFTVALYCLLAVGTALSALALDPLIPSTVSSQIGADAVDRILGILASSMLTVAIFSISTMVQAFASSSTGATPRATRLVVEDRTAQQALATFIGAFLFSLVGLIALSTGVYGPSGRLVLFIVTIGVIILIVVMLLRWIHRLSTLGRIGETIDQVERATRDALRDRSADPHFGGRPTVDVPQQAIPVAASSVGYVARIDTAKLSGVADDLASDVYVAALPGSFMTPDRPVAWIDGSADQATRDAVASCFMIHDQRSFEQDPRFGLIVLSEIASRALSPAVNDPGTAIDVIGTIVRVLTPWGQRDKSAVDVRFPRIWLPSLMASDMLLDSIAPIARDGAAMVEVGIRLQKAMRALRGLGDPDLARAAEQQASDAMARAKTALSFPGDITRLKLSAGDTTT